MKPLQTIAIGDAELAESGQRMLELMRELYPICRSITGPGVRDTLTGFAPASVIADSASTTVASLAALTVSIRARAGLH